MTETPGKFSADANAVGTRIAGPELSHFLHLLCAAAAEETMPRFRTGTNITNKLDHGFDPVTQADREAERVIRALIENHYPDHGITGEEFGVKPSASAYEWIIDPIDGTRAFISGLPLWGTLIGLYCDGVPFAGVMDQPFTRERYVGFDGETHLSIGGGSPQRLKTSNCAALAGATLMTTDPNILLAPEDAGYFNVQNQVKLTRYGCDCYAYCMLAAGHVEVVIESGLNAYDIAALIPVIENAGGVVTNWQGESAAQGGQILACANRNLHEQVVNVLN